jgi:hypothetical protein
VHRGKKEGRGGFPGFAALPSSASGEVRGPLVFVGYAARSDAEGEGKPPVYDDLAGVDLKGKVAVILLEAPGRPDPMALLTRLQDDARRFAEAASAVEGEEGRGGADGAAREGAGGAAGAGRPVHPEGPAGEVWPLPDDV